MEKKEKTKKSGSIGLKILFMAIIVIALIIANVIIGAKVQERDEYRQKAVSSVYDAAGGVFVIKDVSLVVPYVHRIQKTNSKGEKYFEYSNGESTIKSKRLDVNADLVTEIRNVGIYKAPVFSGKVKIESNFICNLRNDADYTYKFRNAKMLIRLKDKSLVEIPVYNVNGKSFDANLTNDFIEFYDCKEYTNYRMPGVYSNITCVEGENTFSTELNIRGAKKFRIEVPENQTRLTVKSDWPSPGFTDYDYLPVKRDISNEGFTAEWFVPFSAGDCKYVGFDYVQPVDVYMMVSRAVTYGFLFIVVPFLVLFMFELFMKVQLHPMHYLLCGAASVVFFLLLLSVSEHIPFGVAYLISALASGLLTSFYVASITKKFKSGIGMVCVFGLLYGYLFFSLKSEDYALLIGSIFVFIVIAALMILTRKVDWNNLKKKSVDNDLQTLEETK